ncbi:hypothetical protein OC834_004168 [Tilletia horrida]|nr:hypothetical protein OC834_004168 [Tilletia horrida]
MFSTPLGMVIAMLAASAAFGGPSYQAAQARRGFNITAAAGATTKPVFGSAGYPVVRGVNLGGYLLLEPWITPDLFLTPDLKALNKFIPDEWTYTQLLGPQEAAARLQVHYATWLTENDFRMMAMHGLNLVRIPIGTWAFNSSDAEPYVGDIQLPYLGQAIKWADKYGLDVIIDLHGLPQSQNGFDNSGQAGSVHFADQSTFVHNAARAMSALIQIVELFVNDPQFNGAVAAIEVINEPIVNEQSKTKTRTDAIPLEKLKDYMRASYSIVQAAILPTALRRPVVMMHDAFMPPGTFDAMFSSERARFEPGTYALDTHIYQAFNGLQMLSDETHLYVACGAGTNLRAAAGSGPTRRPVLVGEWSIGTSSRCVDYFRCEGRTIADDVRTLTDFDPRPVAQVHQPGGTSSSSSSQVQQKLSFQSTFKRRFFEVQTAVYEAHGGTGWVYWNWKTQAAAAWSLKDVFAQGWAPARVDDPSLRIFKYEEGATPCIAAQPGHV